MLGYTETDLDQMIDAVNFAMNYIPQGQDILIKDLKKTSEFLQGLWAEGYFDNV